MTKATYTEPDCADAEFVERLRVVDATTLPQVCTHDESLELYRRAPGAHGAALRTRRPPPCRRCGHALPNNAPLRARDVPGLTHALVFFTLSWTLYLLNPYPPLRGEVAMWTAWLVCFVVSLKLRTPLRSARSALLILFSLSWLLFFMKYWSVITLSYLATHSLDKWADCVFATTPLFVGAGIRALIERLKARGRERVDEF
jgi:hypothetical protein